MFQQPRRTTILAGALLAALHCAVAAATDTPDPGTLLADMQRALIPTTAQFSRVHISTRSDQPGGGTRDWDALVIRQRDDDGPHTALSFVRPDSLIGSGILTAPHATRHALGLWLYSPDEQRTVEFTPLEADRQFLSTRFNFEDVALTTRDTKPPQLRGTERIGQQLAWKVETQPMQDRYYSRIVTWIADDTHLPLKREYYDRSGQLWKVVSYRNQQIDGIPTVMDIELHDVQSRDTAEWRVKALRYARDKLDQRVLSPARLGLMQNLAFWRQVGADANSSESIPHAE